VKPSNIIIQEDEKHKETHNVFLIDYGLSLIRPDEFSKPKGFSAFYSAPEIMQRKPPIPETDFYGLGMSLVYALGGDLIEKTLPNKIHRGIRDFVYSMIKVSPLERPSWEKEDVIGKFSDLRQEIFGRRATSD
jgi:serine/threonine protein kinase